MNINKNLKKLNKLLKQNKIKYRKKLNDMS